MPPAAHARRSFASALLAAASLLVAAACRRAPAPETLDPRPEVSGCAAVRAGGVCEVEAGAELRWLFPGLPGAEVSFSANDRPVAARRDVVRGDARWSLAVPEGARAIVARARRGAGEGAFTLLLAPSRAPEPVVRARRLRGEGALDDAERAVADLAREPTIDGSLARGVLGRIAMSRGDYAEAARLLDRSGRELLEAGELSRGADDLFARAFVLTDRALDYPAARATLATLAARADLPPDSAAALPYYASRVARAVGDAAEERRALGDAEARAERLGLSADLADARTARAMAAADAGRFDEVCSLYQAMRRDPAFDEACSSPRRDANLAIGLLDASEADGRLPPACTESPERLLRDALRGFAARCPEVAAIANAEIALAQAHTRARRLDEAAAALARARAVWKNPTPTQRAFFLVVEGERTLTAGDGAGAARAFREAQRVADEGAVAWLRIKAQVGEARARARQGDDAGASALYAQADAAIDAATLALPLGAGRASFARWLEQATEERLSLLVKARDARPLLEAVRARQARALEDLAVRGRLAALPPEARARWERAASLYAREHADAEGELAALRERSKAARDAGAPAVVARLRRARAALAAELVALLPPPLQAGAAADLDPGTALLAVQPLGGRVLLVLARGGAVRHAVVPSGEGDLGDAWLAPFERDLAGLERLRLMVHPSLDRRNVHAFTLHGRRLDEAFVVSYTLTGRAPPAEPAGAAALVVGDPSGDLPSARREAEAVRDVLAKRGGEVRLLLREGATRGALLEGLRGAGLFHFAGHATFDAREPWQSALALPGEARFDVADVLALERPPRVVVLTACEAVRFEGDALGVGLAFALAGSAAVVGPTDRVDDALIARFSREVYARLGPGALPAQVIREAAAAARGDAGAADLDIRVYGP